MSIKYVTHLNLSQNQLENAVIHKSATAPSSPVEGQMYYNTTDHTFRVYNGTKWLAFADIDGAMAIHGDEFHSKTYEDTANKDTVSLTNSDTNYPSSKLVTTELNKKLDSSAAYVHPNHTGDVTSNGDGATTISNNAVTTDKINAAAVTNAKLASMTANTIKGAISAGAPIDLTPTQVRTMINVADGANNYIHPTYTYTAPTNGTGTTLSSVDFLSTLTVVNGHVTGATKRNLVAGSNVSITASADGNVTIASTDTNTTYSAGTGLSLSGTTFNHSNSVTAGSASEGGATRTLAFGGTFNIPSVDYDAQGHITGKGSITLTMPANPNTDTVTRMKVGAGGTLRSGDFTFLPGTNVSLVENPDRTYTWSATDTTYSAGNGLTLSTTTFALGTPGTVTATSTNGVTASSHTHAIDATVAATASKIMVRDASGRAQIAAPAADADIANKGYVDGLLAANDAMVYKGIIDASTNPNYPIANAGDTYKISVAGRIGGASGPRVEVGDMVICINDGSAAGTHATVGSNWNIIQVNIDGAVIGPASSTADAIALFDGASGKLLKNSAKTLSGLTTDIVAAVNIKTLDTTATTAQSTSASEAIKGTGTVVLHKIAKTGTYSDLIGTPTIGNGQLTISGGTDLNVTAGGTFTANATGNTTTTLSHSNVTRSNTTNNSATLSPGGTTTIVDTVTSSATGHITATNTKTITLDSAIPRKAAANIMGGSTSWVFTHNLNTKDITASVIEIASGDIVYADISATTVNTVTVAFASTIPASTYRIVVIG